MTPKKDKETHRDPTTVYPDNSPTLRRAYRIFGPGLNEPETLENLKNDMFVSGVPEQGETWLTPLGQEVGRTLGVGVAEILEAYGAYKNEIERMNEADRVEKKKKRKQARVGSSGGGGGSEGASEGSSGDEDEEEEDGQYVVEVNASGKIKGEPTVWGEDEDPYEQFWRDAALWLSRQDAISRTRSMRASIAEMNTTLMELQRFYKHKMQPGADLDTVVATSVDHLHDLTDYAAHLEEVIKMHEGKSAGTTWESRVKPGVTFGPNVPWAIYVVHELDERIDDMKPVLTACKRTQGKLAGTKLLTTTKALRVELRVKLVQFATFCLPEEARAEFKKAIEED